MSCGYDYSTSVCNRGCKGFVVRCKHAEEVRIAAAAECEYASWDVSWLAHAPGPSAINTLTAMGYSHHGGVRWVPPLGPIPDRAAEIADRAVAADKERRRREAFDSLPDDYEVN